MCIPILPNKSHPTGRLPLVPDRAFPFDNCYHWMALSIYVRVRARPEGFEEDHAIRLSVDERLRMDGLWEEDDDGRDVEAANDEMSSFDQRIGSSSHSTHSGATASDTELMVQHSPADGIGDVLAQMNIFGDPTHDTELFPLVDLWFEITDHLKQEDIPDPMEIFKERDEIVKIIEEARARANFALNKSLLELNAGCNKASEDCTRTHEAVDVTPQRNLVPSLLVLVPTSDAPFVLFTFEKVNMMLTAISFHLPHARFFPLNMPRFCPMPHRYAAIRMDPTAMVEHFQDPIALAAAQAMKPKTYLVYVEGDLELPFPGKPWYRFCVCPIGTSLRPADAANDLRPEMCIPILPNQSHPTGRLPLVPDESGPAFPYDNCYHWVELAMYVRVRASPQGFANDRAVRLGVDEQIRMMRLWEEDDERRDVESETETEESSCSHDSESSDGDSIRSAATASRSRTTRTDHIGDVLAQMNIFGDPTHDTELFPLVDLWFELTDHLKQEDIPDPMELYRERDEVVKIIEEARSRANAAMNASLRSEPVELGAADDTRDDTPGKNLKARRLRSKHLRLKERGRRMLGGMKGWFRMPYIVIWP
ncbi:hypothetical protein ONZ51_g13276 [Trametes cubensis]|uniref:Uncharacterized protein n=1 Tax=Trametes cubensis TaxID=1111947 RepID=A0AAD7X483_9APHY|nr:hypothetical protein ONZ51_g13276 [Trametes cubensis]